MDKFKLLTEQSLWWTLPALVCSVFFALYLYNKDKTEVSKPVYLILVSLRSALFFTLLFLLINPLINYFKNTINRPHAVIVVDDSESVLQAGIDQKKIDAALKSWEELYAEKGIESHVLTLDGKSLSDSLSFDRPVTDLDGVLNTVIENFQSDNLASITLLTDGIVNQGQSPYYKNYGTKINIVGIGDTTKIIDAAIYKVNVNSISYVSKKIPIEVIVSTQGLPGEKVSVELFKNKELLQEHSIKVEHKEEFLKHTFYVLENEGGVYPYSIRISVDGIEEEIKNNSQKVFLKVIDKSQKILILSEAPHPDIKFIRSILEENQAYDLTFEIRSYSKPFNPIISDYDLVILHGSNNDFIEKYQKWCIKSNVSFVFFSGVNTLSGVGVDMSIVQNERDEVHVSMNSSFKSILLSTNLDKVFESASPLDVPFGNVKVQGNSEVVAYQKVGSVETDKPLIVLVDNGNYRTARILGSGWWKIRLRDKENSEYFDELFGKIFEFTLTNQSDKKLILKSLRDEYSVSQAARIEIKTYDLLGEQILGNEVKLTLYKDKEKLREVSTKVNSLMYQYNFSGLDPGVYRVEGRFEIGGEIHEEKVEFSVNNISLEGLVSEPKFSQMKTFATNHNGLFSRFEENNNDWISSENAPNTISSVEDVFSIIEYKWICLILLFLIFSEWVLRKIYLLD